MSTPAGWYDDGAGSRRWWDGAQWTEHVIATPAAEPLTEPVTEPAAVDAAPEAASSPTEPEPFAPPYLMPSTTPIAPANVPPQGIVASAPAYGGPWAAGSHAPAPASAPASRVSVLGVVGLVAVVIGVVGLCLPVVAIAGWGLLAVGFALALVSLFLRGRKWPGITGMAVAVVGAVLALAVSLVVGLVSAAADDPGLLSGSDEPPSTESTDPSTIEGADMVPFAELEVGDCIPLFEDDDEEGTYEIPVVPCDLPHTDEVYFIFDLEDGEFPGADAVSDAAWDRCLAEFESFVGTPYDTSELDFYPYWPTESSWIRSDDRTVHCVVFSYDDVTGTLRDAKR